MKINQFSGEISVYKKRIVLFINGKKYDISHMLPVRILKTPSPDSFNPLVDWEIRVAMVDATRKFVKAISPEFPVEKICA